MADNGASAYAFDAEEITTLSFEAAYARLEEAVTRLQMGNLSLNDALAAYEEGMALSTHCQDLLERAELRVQVLERPLADNDDDDDDIAFAPDEENLDEPPF